MLCVYKGGSFGEAGQLCEYSKRESGWYHVTFPSGGTARHTDLSFPVFFNKLEEK